MSKHDLQSLEADLRRLVIEGGVSFTPTARALYASDASNYRQVPLGVVVPRTIGAATRTLDVCRAHGVPVLPRGGGTSLAGQGCNHAVVVDLSRHLNRILQVDPEQRRARVEPGVILDDLRAAAEEHGLTFGPDPSTHAWCTLGGMIGNNACGVHSVMAGRTSDNVESLDVVTGDGVRLTVGATSDAELARLCARGDRVGEIYRGLRSLRDSVADEVRAGFPKIPRRVSGYNLDELLPENGFHVARALVGTEGTCVTMLEATVRLIESPPVRMLVLLGYPDMALAADAVVPLLDLELTGLEGTDRALVDNMRALGVEGEGIELLPEGGAWLMVEVGGRDAAEARGRAEEVMARAVTMDPCPTTRLLEDRRQQRAVWRAREAGVGASSRMADDEARARVDTYGGWEDAAVPPERLGSYLRGLKSLAERFGYRLVLYGHFGQGCVHTRFDFDLRTRDGIARYRGFVEAGADLVAEHGGSISGEHGDGHSRAELWPRMFSPALMRAFVRFKEIWDPERRMNPGKLIDPYKLDEHLRYGAGYEDPVVSGQALHYPDDDGSFARATSRCIGVGRCRRTSGEGTMCPSYRVTREERHSTRGRARLLSALVEGELPDRWQNDEVHAALDLCLSCKACKHDCPAGVDMATYKAEFLSARYAGRFPLEAKLFGRVHRWAALASRAPWLANFFAGLPVARLLLQELVGIDAERALPRIASTTLRRQLGAAPASLENADVLLWTDTFTNHFDPGVGLAAAELLGRAGLRFALPPAGLCCGRPLYDFGMLGEARDLLLGTLDALEPALRHDLPVVVLEPGCLSVFRDELRSQLPDDPRAIKLAARAITLAQLLEQRGVPLESAAGGQPVLLHGHCHQQSVGGGTAADARLLTQAGYAVQAPETGCCGLAGSFGFKSRHRDVAQAVAELTLLPAIASAGDDALLVTDGFSCREQIRHTTGRRALHLAELLAQGA